MTTRYSANRTGVLSCCDRIRMFDLKQFALALRERIHDNAVPLAEQWQDSEVAGN